jgi:hypothetical protein
MANINKMIVNGVEIKVKEADGADFISLTGLARQREAEYPSDVIGNWMRNRATIEYLGLWEKLYNPDFNSLEFEGVERKAGRNAFVMTPKRWAETTNAIGIIPAMGKYAEVYAHKDIAFKFASWLSVEFELYVIKEFQRLKKAEQLSLGWTAQRELAKLNYRLQTDAVKENLIVPALTDRQKAFVYANEADLLNVALFGQTAGEWTKKNADKKGNIRDNATLQQLLVLSQIEGYNAILIQDNIKQDERLIKLNNMARKQMSVLMESGSPLLI